MYRCEHYSAPFNKAHLINFDVGNGLYNIKYLEALFDGNPEIIHQIESEGSSIGFDPATPCTTVSNISSVKVNCCESSIESFVSHSISLIACNHHDELGQPVIAQMLQLCCSSKFHIFELLEEFHSECPQVPVVCRYPHTHPIPLPTKTPSLIRSQILSLLESLDQDLPDLTPCRFLRHPTVCTYFNQRLPDVPNPTLSDHAKMLVTV
jgi:hypothetical protein